MAEISSMQTVQNNHEKYAHLFDKTKGNDMINTETFFSLLMAEMSNQDPLEPMSNTEFVSQMAQFTALQSQQDNLKYSMSNYASNLVGKMVTVNSQNEDGTLKKGLCTGVNISGSDVKVIVDGEMYEVSGIRGVSEPEPEKELTDIKTASSFIGKEVTVKVLGDDGKYYYDNGIVDSAEIADDGDAKIVINGYIYSVSEILYVADPNLTTEDTITDSSDEEQLQQIMDIIEGN